MIKPKQAVNWMREFCRELGRQPDPQVDPAPPPLPAPLPDPDPDPEPVGKMVEVGPGDDLDKIISSSAVNEVILAPGIYAVSAAAKKGIKIQNPKIVRAADPSDRPVLRMASDENRGMFFCEHGNVTFKNLVLDLNWKSRAIRFRGAEGEAAIINCEIRNCNHHQIDAIGLDSLLVDGCHLHHALRWVGTHADAHAVVTEDVGELTIRDCVVDHVSGDAYQHSRGKEFTNVLIEGCHFKNSPLDRDIFGFRAGQRPGENGVDTKRVGVAEPSEVTVRDCLFEGYRSDFQPHGAAIVMKERASLKCVNNVFRDCRLVFRLRGVSNGMPLGPVLIEECEIEQSDIGFRLEDDVGEIHPVIVERLRCVAEQHITTAQWKPELKDADPLQWFVATDSQWAGKLPELAPESQGNSVL